MIGLGIALFGLVIPPITSMGSELVQKNGEISLLKDRLAELESLTEEQRARLAELQDASVQLTELQRRLVRIETGMTQEQRPTAQP